MIHGMTGTAAYPGQLVHPRCASRGHQIDYRVGGDADTRERNLPLAVLPGAHPGKPHDPFVEIDGAHRVSHPEDHMIQTRVHLPASLPTLATFATVMPATERPPGTSEHATPTARVDDLQAAPDGERL